MEIVRELLTILALLGTGGVVGSWINEVRQSRREDRLRWHTNRRETYERLLTGAHEWRTAELEIAECIGTLRELTGWESDPIFDEAWFLRQTDSHADEVVAYLASKVRRLRPQADEFRRGVNSSVAAIEMVSSTEVVRHAIQVRGALQLLVDTSGEFPPRECGGWSEPLVRASEKYEEARRNLIEVVRKELGVK
ncbi:MAG TPA: hypothetical protein VHG28_17325 [Longimicrobiaceae bacterium]|nr:hypothetical protein [Longimicrobiaceae bacterium]